MFRLWIDSNTVFQSILFEKKKVTHSCLQKKTIFMYLKLVYCSHEYDLSDITTEEQTFQIGMLVKDSFITLTGASCWVVGPHALISRENSGSNVEATIIHHSVL